MKPSHVVASRATTIKCPAARRATTRHKSVRGDISGNNKKNREETGLEKNRQVVAAKRNEGRDGLTGKTKGEGKKGIAVLLFPSTSPNPLPLVYDVALDGGGRRKYEENFFSRAFPGLSVG